MNYGFVKVAAAVPEVRVADTKYNVQQIESLVIQAEGHGVEIICLPELSLTSYTCADLFAQQLLLDEAEMALIHLMNFSRSLDIISIVGLPVSYKGSLLNCAAVIQKGKILGLVPKTYLPNYKEFQERRWFFSGADIDAEATIWLCGQQVQLSSTLLFRTPTCTFGVELCEDLWAPIPPSSQLALEGAEIIFNLSADNDVVGKRAYLDDLLSQQSARCIAGYVYAAAGFGESTQDLVFSGKAVILEKGIMLADAPHNTISPHLIESEIDVELLRTERRMNTTFAANAANTHTHPYTILESALISPHEFKLTRRINAHPFVPAGCELDERCHEIFSIQSQGLAKRLLHTGSKTAVIGISGGLDSTLALLVTVRAFDLLHLERKGITGITMPGFGTTDRTHTNALQLMKALGITTREIPIGPAVTQHFRDILHNPTVQDTTYENSQARERTQILMDVANQVGGMVIGTGDLSELALGWCTYNGDHMSMYGVNAGVPKTLVRHLVRWVATTDLQDFSMKSAGSPATPSSATIPSSPVSSSTVPSAVLPMSSATNATSPTADPAAILLDIVDTPISPELIPANPNGEIQQKTEDLVGPYELHDFFIYHALRHGFRPGKILYLAEIAFQNTYTSDVIRHWLQTFYRRFFSQQFKRSCMPDGPKVGSISLSPRGDWRMPSDACRDLWLDECERL